MFASAGLELSSKGLFISHVLRRQNCAKGVAAHAGIVLEVSPEHRASGEIIIIFKIMCCASSSLSVGSDSFLQLIQSSYSEGIKISY